MPCTEYLNSGLPLAGIPIFEKLCIVVILCVLQVKVKQKCQALSTRKKACKFFFVAPFHIAWAAPAFIRSLQTRHHHLLGNLANQNNSEAYRRRLDGVAISTYALCMIFVPLKLYCRKRSGGWNNIRLDDYMSVVALLFANAFFYVAIIGRQMTKERIARRN